PLSLSLSLSLYPSIYIPLSLSLSLSLSRSLCLSCLLMRPPSPYKHLYQTLTPPISNPITVFNALPLCICLLQYLCLTPAVWLLITTTSHQSFILLFLSFH